MNLKEFLDKDLENVTKCAWFLRANEKEFSYEEYSFSALEMLICRYYGYVPRVINLEDNMETK